MKANGPTLNPSYNSLLLDWKRQGYSSNPECEECSCDLTGKEVRDIGTMWVCVKCASRDEIKSDYRHEERKQLGIPI